MQSEAYVVMWGDGEQAFIEAVTLDKTVAEMIVRRLKDTDDGRGYIYWIVVKPLI